MREISTVAEVVKDGLCNTCGGCKWVCKAGAIDYLETLGGYLLPTVDNDKCKQCGLCVTICPGKGFGADLVSALPSDPFVGQVRGTFAGKSTDARVFANSQSGGVVTSILSAAMEKKEIGGAVAVQMFSGAPPRPKAVLIKETAELINTQKSKYCPVPLLNILDEVVACPFPVAVVGIPCQLHGLQNIFEWFPKVKEKVRFTVGLVCDRIMTFAAMDYLIQQAGMEMQNFSMMHFRDKLCGGYPGKVHFLKKNRESITLSPRHRSKIKDYFTPARCRICFDKLNVFADIVVGDPHGVSDIDRVNGESMAILRTKIGEYFFHEAKKSGHLSAREIPREEVVKGQGIENKRVEWSGYVKCWQNLKRPLPNYCSLVLKSVSQPVDPSRYLRRLNMSLTLDNHPTRDKLLRATKIRLINYYPKKFMLALLRRLRSFLYE
jgi:coenzyme F420 hydrogenase subunit beta